MHAKAKGAYNMHLATQNCSELDHFVMWSSLVASAGNEGAFFNLHILAFVPFQTAAFSMEDVSIHVYV